MAGKKTNNAQRKRATAPKQKVSVRYEDLHFIDTSGPVWNYSLFSEKAIADFQNGVNHTLYHVFGSRPLTVKEKPGYYFAV